MLPHRRNMLNETETALNVNAPCSCKYSIIFCLMFQPEPRIRFRSPPVRCRMIPAVRKNTHRRVLSFKSAFRKHTYYTLNTDACFNLDPFKTDRALIYRLLWLNFAAGKIAVSRAGSPQFIWHIQCITLFSVCQHLIIWINLLSFAEFGRKPSFCAYGVLFSVLILLFHICDIFLPYFAELTCFRSAHCFPCKHMPPTSNIFVFRCFDGQNMLANRSLPWYNGSVWNNSPVRIFGAVPLCGSPKRWCAGRK